MDTRRLEQIGETCIISRLLAANILVAKPFFDQVGTDLLGFISVDDKARFCRIQCKYRELKASTSITMDATYVVGAFILVLYLKGRQGTQLHCFLPDDIRRYFRKTRSGKKTVLRLRISAKTETALRNDATIAFTAEKVTAIFNMIKSSSPDAEFRRLLSSLAKKTRELLKAQRMHRELRELLHEIEVAELERKACEENRQILEEYTAHLGENLGRQNSRE